MYSQYFIINTCSLLWIFVFSFFRSRPIPLTKYIGDHYSWDIHRIQDVTFVSIKLILLQMYCKPESGTSVMDRQTELRPHSRPDTNRMPYSWHDTRFRAHLEHAYPASMDLRPNSGPDTPPGSLLEHQTPDSIRTACLERERANRYRMMVYWDGPRYPSYCSYTARQRSLKNKDWPHKTLSIQALRAAGFFYTCEELCILLLNKQHMYSFYFTPSHNCLSSPYMVRWRNIR